MALPVYLEQREDKIAVITESGPYSAINIAERIKNRVNPDDTVKAADENVIIVTLSGSRNVFPGEFRDQLLKEYTRRKICDKNFLRFVPKSDAGSNR